MADTPTLSTAPLEHPALDYAFLRREGIRHLEELAGHLWTDFNTHDPGITILEQLCYAITDLAYRVTHSVPDLLASSRGDANRSLYSAAAILTSHPVTLLDLRKLVVDVEGVKNAWVVELAEPRQALHYHDDKHELRLQPDPPYTTPTRIQGLVRVLIDKSDAEDIPSDTVQREVARRLHAARPLCADFDEIQVLAPQKIQAAVAVEIGPVDDAERVLVDIHQVLAEYISPTVRFHTLSEMLAAGKRSDEIFDGPALAHGFVDSEALAGMRRRSVIQTSDLIREIMAIPGVRAVLSIAVSANGTSYEPWVLPLDPAKAPRLDLEGSSITLMRGRITARLDARRVIAALKLRGQQGARRQLPVGERDHVAPASRDRDVAHYRSIQHELPVLYGVGPAGVPASASRRRRAQAHQLKAYLLFFDQLLAGFFAELGHLGALFSFHTDDAGTYVTPMVDDPELDLDAVRVRHGDEHRAALAGIARRLTPDAFLSERKNRFYSHLMARFAEQFTDYSLVLLGARLRAPDADDERLVPDKQAFLQRYPRISGARGTGRDVLEPRGEVAGLQERIERKLGLAEGERFMLVEHLLLAPVREDDVAPGKLEYKQKPVVTDCPLPDPYSLQLSFVIPAARGRLRQAKGETNELRLLVEHTIREETPAHLTPYVRWLDDAAWAPFAEAYAGWLDAYGAYRAERLGLQPPGAPRWLRMRDARDRLIDLLGFGETYPLRDLPVRDERLTVPFKQSAQIPIEYSQRGVLYQLIGAGDQVLAAAEGTGATILLTTPPMQEDTTFDILARKLVSGREAYLVQQATVKVGLDVTLPARVLDAELLIPRDPPGDGDVRIVPWSTPVRVQVDHAQEGVDYRLVRVVDGKEQNASPQVRGNLGDIVLVADPALEDGDLRVRATKVFDPSEHRKSQTDLLDAVLPLAVRARPGLPVAIEPAAVVAYGGDANVRVDETQASAEYLVFVRDVRDSEFVFGVGDPDVIAVDAEGGRVQVRRPPAPARWQDIERFKPVGAPVRGNGGALRIPVAGLREDSVILVRASKQHRQADATVPSAVQLTQAALVLVRPDPRAALKLGVVLAAGKTSGTLDFAGGQPGVFYQARRDPGGASVGLPAYFHKVDEIDAAQNKGFDQLRVGVDFAVTRGPERKATTRSELMTTRPLAPRVVTGALDAGTTLSFLATRAMTRVSIALDATARIPALPKIEAPASVPKGQVANVVVRASVAGDRYQLVRDGKAIGEARDGDGGDLTLTTDALQANAQFEVRVTRPAEAGIPVARIAMIAVTVT